MNLALLLLLAAPPVQAPAAQAAPPADAPARSPGDPAAQPAASDAEPETPQFEFMPPGKRLTYRGSVTSVKESPSSPDKKFSFALLVSEREEETATFDWLVQEQGAGGWSWVDRFGRMKLREFDRVVEGRGPSLLYDYGSGAGIIALEPPFFEAGRDLAEGQTWKRAGLAFRAEAGEMKANRETWKITVSTAFGRKRTIWVDRQWPLVVALDERIVLGQGVEYTLSYELAAESQLQPAEFERESAALARLLKLHSDLGDRERKQTVNWSSAQQRLLKRELPALKKSLAESAYAALVTAAERDLAEQSGRTEAVAQLKKKVVGAAPEPFALMSLAGKQFDSTSLKGQVTVLHFWRYREPLTEPYGQIGYLDFLYRKRKEAGLQVFGVAVDPRFANRLKRDEAVREVKKLKAFMNLSYPVLLDDGQALTLLGDPRKLGAKLPLFVVVGRDGKVLHYHVGPYKVNRDRGLEKLDFIVRAALDSGK